ncbi:hypothetical protein [Mongoliibacter ruber]|uniref:Uncharacterized protein n=1 Tax=Mongoliibacter ruber TaxID=1750599 RepID=A0A2T0WVF2_9BACT|nr:hypothetical protein [Mongoliibacter ruber]PRY90681.1 hypothetical protein CLW00_101346 [Mongoliibacter ruber]
MKEYVIKLERKVDGKEITCTQTLTDAAFQTLQGFIRETCQIKGHQFLLKEIYLRDFKVCVSDFNKNTNPSHRES